MRSFVWRLAAAVGIGICWLGGAFADSRVALVIGNSSYRSIAALPNPANDAKAIGSLLSNAGFEVVFAPDLGQSEMRRAIRDFAAKLADKGPDTVALVFYAGHGLQVDGENFLVPIDARIQRESDVAIEALRLGDLMNALAAVPAKMRIVILDACRNNPFADIKQTGGKGLAIVDAPTGSIVAYSTAPGTEATDGAGANSPYTAALIDVAQQPNMPIEQVFKQVRLKVHQATSGNQTPWESSSLTGDFWFLPVAATAGPATPEPAPGIAVPESATRAATMAPVAPAAPIAAVAPEQRRAARIAQIRTLPPARAYEIAVEEDAVEFYEEFVVVYPDDPLTEMVRRMLARRVDALAWRHAAIVNTPAAYAAYAANVPGGDYAEQALRLQARPRLRQIDPVFVPKRIAPPPPVRVALPIFQPRPAGLTRPVAPVNVAPRLPPPVLVAPGAMPPGTPGARPGGPPPVATLPPPAPGTKFPGAPLPGTPGARPGGLPPAAALPVPAPGTKLPGVPPPGPPGARPGGLPPAAALPPPAPGTKFPGAPLPGTPGARPGGLPPAAALPVSAPGTRLPGAPPPGTPGTRPGGPPPVATLPPPRVGVTPPPKAVMPPRPALTPPPRPAMVVAPKPVVAQRPPPPPPPRAPAAPARKCAIVNGKSVCR